MASKRSLTHAEFELVKPYLHRISPERQHIAYQALVLDLAHSKLADENKISRQLIQQLTKNVMNKFEKIKPIGEGIITPEGWSKVTFFGPLELMNELKEIYQKKIASTTLHD